MAGYIFEVVDMDGRRIDKVLIVPPAGLRHRISQTPRPATLR
ncbi:MAG: hypothetical protein U0Z44_00825 [Kouleothrix sp.]